MDSIISLGQKNTLAEYMILSGADNRPPMLDKDRLPADIYSLVNHHRVAKDLWERVQLLIVSRYLFDKARKRGEAVGCMLISLAQIQGNLSHELHEFTPAALTNMNIYRNEMEHFQSFAVPVFSLGDDSIACLNKAMAFLIAVATSRFPSTNNQLRTFSNPKNQATLQDGRVTMQQVHGRQGQNYSGTTTYGMQCTQPTRQGIATLLNEKAMVTKLHEAGQILILSNSHFLISRNSS
ncbi:hypothetical protein Tco_0273533 [Tanacetum coccineum]